MWSTETSCPAALRASFSRLSLSPSRWERSARRDARNAPRSFLANGDFGRGFGGGGGGGARRPAGFFGGAFAFGAGLRAVRVGFFDDALGLTWTPDSCAGGGR